MSTTTNLGLTKPAPGQQNWGAAINTNLDLIDSAISIGGARVYNSVAESINHATPTVLTFDSETYDSGSFHSVVSNTSRLTISRTGIYLINGMVRFAPAVTGQRVAHILLSGTDIIASAQGVQDSGIDAIMTPTTIYSLAAGQYIELQVYQSSGGQLDVKAFGGSPSFSIRFLGES